MLRKLFFPTVLILLIFFVYAPAINYGIAPWDDESFIFEVPKIQNPSFNHIIDFWKEGFEGMYTPISYTLLSMIATLSKLFPSSGSTGNLNPHLFHFINILIHCLNSLLVYLILIIVGRYNQAGEDYPNQNPEEQAQFAPEFYAFLGTALFAIHPVQVESVVQIFGFSGLLSSLLSLCAIGLYCSQCSDPETEAGSLQKLIFRSKIFREKKYYLGIFLYLCALLSKPSVVVLPLVIGVLAVLLLKHRIKRTVLALFPWIILSIPFVLIAKSLQPDDALFFVTPPWARFFIFGDTIAFYLYKLVFPYQLGIIYQHNPEYVLAQVWGYFTWLVPGIIVFLIWFYRNKSRWFAASFFVFVLGFLPVSGMVPFVFQNLSGVADRYLYLSILGPAFLIYRISSQLRNRFFGIFLMTVLLILSVKTIKQSTTWKNPITFLNHSLSVSNHVILHRSFGKFFLRSGDFEGAIKHFKRYLKPGFKVTAADRQESRIQIEIHTRLTYAYQQVGNTRKALEHSQKAVPLLKDYFALNPNEISLLVKMGNLLSNIGTLRADPDYYLKAKKYYLRGLKLNPGLKEINYYLASNNLKSGQFVQAIKQYQQELINNPNHGRTHFELGILLTHIGRVSNGMKHLKQAIELSPEHQNYARIYQEALFKKAASKGQQNKMESKDKIIFDSNSSPSNFQLGKILSKLTLFKLANKYYQRALLIEVDLVDVNYFMAINFRKMQQLKKAITYYRKEIQLVPENANVHNDLGIVLVQSGNKAEGLLHLQKALTIEPENPNFRANLKKATGYQP
ncbi:MAG: tetratricopeptide repeat protein [Proteobacteria bacterium]|nr:tetratricopeptide repeat protein [Pseudomonadota bacterium]